jgi:hypothetical protein
MQSDLEEGQQRRNKRFGQRRLGEQEEVEEEEEE